MKLCWKTNLHSLEIEIIIDLKIDIIIIIIDILQMNTIIENMTIVIQVSILVKNHLEDHSNQKFVLDLDQNHIMLKIQDRVQHPHQVHHLIWFIILKVSLNRLPKRIR